MTFLTFVDNPFDPTRSCDRVSYQFDGGTICQVLRHHFGPGFEEFDKPTVCQLNGQPMLRETWDTVELEDGDQLMFVTMPQGAVAIVLAVISIAIAIGIYFLLGDPKIPGEGPASDAVYTLRGQNNRYRPGEPVEVVYGRCRIWPTFITQPYSRYIGNQQYQYSLFCMGQGDFEIHGTFIDDTPTSRFDEVEIELCPPGTEVTLVESAVYQALEVSNIELLGPNEDGYEVSGPYIVNEWANPVRRLEVDINFPSGLYRMNEEGQIRAETVELLFEYRQINEAGGPIGSWTTLVNPTVTRSSNTPQRLTYTVGGLTSGRYEIRGRRITARPDDSKRINQVRWEAAKGYSRLPNNFGNVYLIAMKAKATNQLNDQSSRAFNVKATRKLPIWNGSTWSAPTATRNPVWAFCDILRSNYGGKLETTYMDMPTLLSLATLLNSRSDHFDWIFDSTLTVWEAAKMALRVGRSTPLPQGAVITAVRDQASDTVVAVFNPHNIVRGSLSKQLSLFQFQPFDGILMEYTDQDTWKPETVECVLPGRAGTNLERLKIPGCTNRNRALREGLYMQSRREYQRTTVSFRTGMEGYIPVYMDRIAVTHDTVRVGQAGMVLAYNSGTKIMTLSEKVTFGPPTLQHVIALRGDDGGMLGSPIAVTPVDGEPNQVELAEDPAAELDFSSDRVPPLYAFGLADLWTFHGKVISVKPVDFQTIEITAVNYVDDSYTHDETESVPVDELPVITDPGDPEVAWVEITGTVDDASVVSVFWELVPGAASYVLQTRYTDTGTDEAWTEQGTFATGPVALAVQVGTLVARVAPFSANGNAIWTESAPYDTGSAVSAPSAPGEASQDPFEGLTATVRWIPLADAWGFIVETWIPGALAPLRSENVGAASSYIYTRAMFEADEDTENSRTLEFRIAGFNAGGPGTPLVVELTNTLPAAPSSLAAGSPTGDDYPVTWSGGSEEDFDTFKVYASTTPGFTPGPGNLVEETATAASTVTAPTTTYWRVGAVDVWGGETLSAEQTITV